MQGVKEKGQKHRGLCKDRERFYMMLCWQINVIVVQT